MFAALAPLRHRLRRFRLLVLRRRRLLAALLVGLATWVGVQAAMAPPSPTTPVWTLARDLPGGTVLSSGDLVESAYLEDSRPSGAIEDPTSVLGRPLAHAVAQGQPVSESMVLGERWVSVQGGDSVVPVRVSDPEVVKLLRVGDRVDLYATDVSGTGAAKPVFLAAGVRVAAIPREASTVSSAALPGRLVLLALPASRVEAVTSAAARQFISIAWSR